MSEKTPPDSNNEGNDGISRRRFLGAAAIGGVGVAAALVYQTTSDTAEEGGPLQIPRTQLERVPLPRTPQTQLERVIPPKTQVKLPY